MSVGLIRRMIIWSSILLGVLATGVIVVNSMPRKYTTQPTFALTYSQEVDEVRLSVQNVRLQTATQVDVWLQSAPGTPLRPVQKLTFKPGGLGNGSTPIRVPVDSPLTLQEHEIAYYTLTPAMAEDDVTVAFMVNGTRTTETYQGLKR